jgi:hypothetical protein
MPKNESKLEELLNEVLKKNDEILLNQEEIIEKLDNISRFGPDYEVYRPGNPD